MSMSVLFCFLVVPILFPPLLFRLYVLSSFYFIFFFCFSFFFESYIYLSIGQRFFIFCL